MPLPAPLGNESYTSRQLASCRALHTLRLCARSPRWKGISFAFTLSTSMGTFCVEPLFVTHTCTTPPPCPRSQVGHAIGGAGRRPCHARRRSPCPQSSRISGLGARPLPFQPSPSASPTPPGPAFPVSRILPLHTFPPTFACQPSHGAAAVAAAHSVEDALLLARVQSGQDALELGETCA